MEKKGSPLGEVREQKSSRKQTGRAERQGWELQLATAIPAHPWVAPCLLLVGPPFPKYG